MTDTIFRISVNPRVCLLTLSTVCALRGNVTGKTKREVLSGKFAWVFDFSLTGEGPDFRSQALRFWVADVADELGVKNLCLEEVVDQILPPAFSSFTCEDLCLRFSVNRATLCRMRKGWECSRGRIKRDLLAGFLKWRWLGRHTP